MSIPAETEGGIQAGCRNLLLALGAVVIRINSGAMKVGKRFVKFNSEPGCSDLIVCLRGRFIAVEVKKPGGRTEAKRKAEQQSFAAWVVRAGGIALTVYSVKELEDDLKGEGLL